MLNNSTFLYSTFFHRLENNCQSIKFYIFLWCIEYQCLKVYSIWCLSLLWSPQQRGWDLLSSLVSFLSIRFTERWIKELAQKLLILIMELGKVKMAPLTLNWFTFKGIYKNTWAASDPIECYNWMTNFLPVLPEASDCKDGHYCECAIQGRVHTLSTRNPHDKFGLHTVNCSHHPVGPWPLRQIEDIFGEKLANFTNSYHPFMDHNMGFWANDLDPYIARFHLADVPMGAMEWRWEGKKYYR